MCDDIRVSSPASSKTFFDQAIVLRGQKLGDADKIVILLTRNHGIVHAVAKGARKTTSKFGGRLEPFMLVDVSLTAGKNLHTLTQVQTVRAYTSPIMSDYSAYLAGIALIELTESLGKFEEGESSNKLFVMLAGALSSLSSQRLRPLDIVNAYFLRAISLAGWGMNPTVCSHCGSSENLRWFSAEAGLLCENCGRLEVLNVSKPVSEETLHYLSAVFLGRWESVTAISSQHSAKIAYGLISTFVHWQLEKPLKSLALIEKEF